MAATLNTNASATISARPGAGRTPSSPWTQIVARGPESEGPAVPAPVIPSSLPPSDTPVAATTVVVAGQTTAPTKGVSSAENQEVEPLPESAENGAASNGSKKPVWKKPSNNNPETGAVMGGASWPSLSESTKASPKPSDPSAKSSSDAPASPPRSQVGGATPTNPSSTVTVPLSTQRQMNSNPNPNSPHATSNHGRPARQRSMKREGGVSNQAPHPTVATFGDTLHNNNNDNSPKTGSSVSDSSGKEHGHNNNHGPRESGQRSGGGDHTHQRSSFRRGGGGGSNSRGDSSSHQGYANRRGGQDKGNHDWSHPRGFNGRDPVMPLQGVPPRGFMRPQSPAVSPVPPPPGIRPHYAAPIGIPPELQTPLYYFGHTGISGMPFVPQMPAPAYFFPPYDPQLPAKILNQIDYYFSNENLIKDTYLRQNMDENGWVSVHLIAGFKKVKLLTADVQLILDAVRASAVVETLGDKIRRRDDWKKWIMPPSVLPSRDYPIAEQFQGMVLDERTASPGIVDSRSANPSLSSPRGRSGQQESSK